MRLLGTSDEVHLTVSDKVTPRNVSHDALLSRCSLTRKLCQPAVGTAPLGIAPTPVPALKQTFAASAERRCHSRMAPMLLTNARSGALCVLEPTSPRTGAVRSATGRSHPSCTMLHRKVKLAQEEKTLSSTEARLSGTATRGLALYLQPCSVPAPWRACPWAFPARPNSSTDLKPRGLVCGRVHPTRPS
ncbi:hypothetical protein HPB51_016814 [Rhipicephalus microplus]|uniref:Uncharacterized protein n=1 Tax=Rhipicephalus microplus TaxID=6941 RepID=A0A9J6DIK6_RHIMP|nr:hypothetical protein HPB51_016814 [Rhipicephalus microplus]